MKLTAIALPYGGAIICAQVYYFFGTVRGAKSSTRTSLHEAFTQLCHQLIETTSFVTLSQYSPKP